MRYLRLYDNDSVFKTKEQASGGTGNDVETIVPGLVRTVDERKMYFNPHGKEKQFYTVTVNYKNSTGNLIANSDTIRVKYIPGVSQEVVLTPKNIENYTPIEAKKTIVVPSENSVNFRYKVSTDFYKNYLTFNIISSGTICWKTQNTSYRTTIEYKKNNGEWTSITSNTGSSAPSISVSAGDAVQFRGNNATYSSDTLRCNTFSGSTAKFNAEGNIMSLIDSTGFTTATTLESAYTFYFLFRDCTGLTSAEYLILPATTLNLSCYGYMFQNCVSLVTAPELPATTLANSCYYCMFRGCTSLTTAPTLPVTTLANSCYSSMFLGCTSLTTAPVLPATALTGACYNNMFRNCTSLVTAPELPATTLGSLCYNSMFNGCTSLITAPELPATTLTISCYEKMFNGCTSLITAPELPATTLTTACYNNMFNGCGNLNYIKCLATDISAVACTENWVNGVASSGTFVKASSMAGWTTSVNGIPNGWEVQNN